ncbi:MAG: hypothetical protein HY788_23025 [Deltaproteobacteria bacterium]|nr:hypothetical protein [Deltaproteobacteria bacterium]
MSRWQFDKRDYQLLDIVNDVLTRDQSRKHARKLVYPYLHPHGIKELAESRGLRIAFAVVHLLESLETGELDDRLDALRSLREEVLSTAVGALPLNTARVLLTIMKELVRAHGDERRQLELAHDFRTAAAGNPRIVRNQLRRYHLLEMSEAWNQVTFDDHVHDVNTKGRKSSSHLIMDAWIKGIRRLRVIYYNYLEAKFAVELLQAAEIMGITVRIGIEFFTRIRDRYAQIIWVPRGFHDVQAFLCFLAEGPVASFMEEGRRVSRFQQRYVNAVLNEFNVRHRHDISKAFGFDMPELDPAEFSAFVGTGQASVVHLAEFIHKKMLARMRTHVIALRERFKTASDNERAGIENLLQSMNRMDTEAIMETFLKPSANPHIPNPNIPAEGPEAPRLLNLSARQLIERLSKLHPVYYVTLNLTNLRAEDVLELLYDCEGAISRLEIFNLKDYAEGKTAHFEQINELQTAINGGNVVHLKRMILSMIDRLNSGGGDPDRIAKLHDILHDIGSLKDTYKGAPIEARIGSDSTGRAPRVHGMGLAIKETLTKRARKEIDHPKGPVRDIIPVTAQAFRRTTHLPRGGESKAARSFFRFVRRLPCVGFLAEARREDWVVAEDSIRLESPGNIVTLGGVQAEVSNGLTLDPPTTKAEKRGLSWKYLNTGVKNGLKLLIGFIPAFLTFYLTKDWWLLAYFGAFIWFGITGLRIVLQSVLGGGGIRRSPLLRWDDFVSWERITDSLMYTGFSVPLLDYVVKTVLLDRGFGITTSTNPAALYTVIALANGLYISSHNAFRGFPKGAVYGNLFRTLVSVPIAVAFNTIAGGALAFAGVIGVDVILQKWAAVISKLASDLVAGFLEGTVDRYQNIRMRWRDYSSKLVNLFDTYAQLELLFPEKDASELLRESQELEARAGGELRGLRKIIIINALDLLYFWMLQPRARVTLRAILSTLPPEERRIFIGSQSILREQEEISLMFVHGLVGKNFSRALSFYLDRSGEYLDALKKWEERPPAG